MKNFILVFSIFSFLLASYSVWKNSDLTAQNQVLSQEIEALKNQEPKEEIELAVIMTRMQIHFNKLWFAGSYENWELAQFYVHEIEESLEILTDNNIEDDGINISSLAKVMTKKSFHELEESVKKGVLDDFKTQYKNMVLTCNKCHQAANHRFIQIKVPEKPVLDNQVYQKQTP